MAAVVYGSNRDGHTLLRLNRTALTGSDFDHVLLWARREVARGKRVSWLLPGDLDDLRQL